MTTPEPKYDEAAKLCLEIDVLSDDVDRIRWTMAVNPNTPPIVLEKLTRVGSARLLERIAENPRASRTTLDALARHESADVRAAVAEHLNCAEETLWLLATDECPDVRYRLAESYSVPPAILDALSEDCNPYVSYRAQTTRQRREVKVSDSSENWPTLPQCDDRPRKKFATS